jgi:hypothetical protein
VVVRRHLAAKAALAVGVIIVSFTGLAPPASAASGSLAGTATSVDADCSNQTMAIKCAGKAGVLGLPS